jgi:hypothetical protein
MEKKISVHLTEIDEKWINGGTVEEWRDIETSDTHAHPHALF